jgi:hypothetical protein
MGLFHRLAPAKYSGIEPILQATCSRAWARLGSLSMDQQGAAFPHRRYDRGCFRRDRSPNGVAWRFPDWTAVGYAIPSPFLGSAPLGIPLPEHSRLYRLDPTMDGRLSLRGGWITGGDSNPDCLASAFLRRLLGWPGRWPPTFAVPAFDCFARSFALKKAGLGCQERSPISPVTFMPDDARKYIAVQAEFLVFSKICGVGFRRLAQILAGKGGSRCTKWWII